MLGGWSELLQRSVRSSVPVVEAIAAAADEMSTRDPTIRSTTRGHHNRDSRSRNPRVERSTGVNRLDWLEKVVSEHLVGKDAGPPEPSLQRA